MERVSGVQVTLSREDWLNAGLEVLVEVGGSAMTVGELARHLGVTRGSFYWHFKNVTEFQDAMFNLWQKKLVRAATTDAKASSSPVEELLRSIAHRNLPGFDHAIRAWAATNPLAAKAVRRTDEFRLARVTEILHAYGLTLEAAKVRAQAIIWALKGTRDESNLRWRNKVFVELFRMSATE